MNGRRTFVGVYDSAQAANAAQQRIEATLAALPHDGETTESAQVELLGPGRKVGRIEHPSDHRRTGWSIVRTHVVGGAIGLAVGALIAARVQFSASGTLLPTAGLWTASLFFGLALGLMGGGAVALRPAAGQLWSRVRDESRAGHWQVVATLSGRDAVEQVQTVLRETARDTFWAPGH